MHKLILELTDKQTFEWFAENLEQLVLTALEDEFLPGDFEISAYPDEFDMSWDIEVDEEIDTDDDEEGMLDDVAYQQFLQL